MICARDFVVPAVCVCVFGTGIAVLSAPVMFNLPAPTKVTGAVTGSTLTVSNTRQSTNGSGMSVSAYGPALNATSTDDEGIIGTSEVQGHNGVNGTGINGATGVIGMSDTGPSGVFLGGTGVSSESGSSSYSAFAATSTMGGSGYSADVTGGGDGIYASTDTGNGGYFQATQDGAGVYATGPTAILGTNSAENTAAINGSATGSNAAGIYGSASGSTGSGVVGYSASTGAGGYFSSAAGSGVVVENTANSYTALYVSATGTGSEGLNVVSENGPGLAVNSGGSYPVFVANADNASLAAIDDGGNLYLRGTVHPDAYSSSNALTGESQLIRGSSSVHLTSRAKHELNGATYLVTITPEGDSRGVYVTNRTADGFEIHENMQGRDTLAFTYHIEPMQSATKPVLQRGAVTKIRPLQTVRKPSPPAIRVPRFTLHVFP